jgi:hypothetical protein
LLLRKYDVQEPQWSKEDHDYDTERFVGFAVCDRADCGDVVSVAGEIDVVEIDTDQGMYNQRVLQPMFQVPTEMPEAVALELQTSFQHYWSDLGSCASRLRTSVERLMDHFGIAKTELVKKSGGGRRRKRVDLYKRIERFCSAAKNVVHQDSLHAIRTVGNLGTHGDDLSSDLVLDAYEVYGHALNEIVGRRSAQIRSLARKLKKAK